MKSAWLFLVAFILAVALQWYRGAYHHDLGGDPDESAHAVTSLMLREYLVNSNDQAPMEFVKHYYERFSKVALGHYPPGYYAIGALALLVHKSVSSLLILQALINACMVVIIARIGKHLTSKSLATVTALSWLFLAQVQRFTACVMADQLVALLTLGAAYLFYLYLTTARARYALYFGFVAALTILTKGSGWSLAMLPAFTFLLSWEFRWLKQWRLWIATIPVILLAFPWQYFSSKISKEGFTSIPLDEYFLQAFPFFLNETVSNLGWLILLPAIGSLIMTWFGRGSLEERRLISVLTATIMVVILIMSVVPVGMTSRYLIPIFAPVLLLASTTWQKLFGKRVSSTHAIAMTWALTLTVSLYFTFQTRDVTKYITGFEAAYDRAKIALQDPSKHILVLSDPRGEGAVIARGAFTTNDPTLEVGRASKVLAKMDWMGRGYVAAASSETEMLALLEREGYGAVLLDLSTPKSRVQPYQATLQSALQNAENPWRLHEELSVQRARNVFGQVQLWIRES